jgi:hypothetical protein
MPFPDEVQAALATPRFWTDFFWLTSSHKQRYFPQRQIDFRLGGPYKLSLNIGSYLGDMRLDFRSADAWAREIGYDDQAHWFHHGLRWTELETISKAVATCDPTMPHPGPVLLLLYRFAPICKADDQEHVVGMLYHAWKRLGLFSDREIRRFIERKDCTKSDLTWHFDGEHEYWWIAWGEDPRKARGTYTRRYDKAYNYKWSPEQWNLLLAKAQRIAEGERCDNNDEDGFASDSDYYDSSEEEEDVEQRGKSEKVPPLVAEEVIAAGPFRAPFSLRERHYLRLHLSIADYSTGEPYIHCATALYMKLVLSHTMRILDLGSADTSASSSTTIKGKSVTTSDTLAVNICGDLAPGLRYLKEMLWWLGAPKDTSVSDGNYNDIDFDLAQKETDWDGTRKTYLSFFKPGVLPDCSWLVGHILPDSCRSDLEEVVAADPTVKLMGPDENGWFVVFSTAGGEMAINLSRMDPDDLEGSGLVELRKVTPDIVDILHQFLEKGGMVIAPLGLSAGEVEVPADKYPWPKHKPVTSEELYEILEDGAYERWSNIAKTGWSVRKKVASSNSGI